MSDREKVALEDYTAMLAQLGVITPLQAAQVSQRLTELEIRDRNMRQAAQP